MTKQVESTLAKQIDIFRRPFEHYKLYKDEFDKLIIAKSIEFDRQAHTWEIPYEEERAIYKKYPYSNKWNWDESWDGNLIDTMYALEKIGFRVVSFTRARKIRLAGFSALTQVELFSKIHECTGDIANVKFTCGGIWIQLEKPKRIKPKKDNSKKSVS